MGGAVRLEDLPDEVCPWCGKPFETRRTDQKFCSVACQIESVETFRKIVRREENRRAASGLTCRQCGAKFDGTRRTQLYCSDRCNQIAFNYRKRTGPAVCRHCGKPFVPTKPRQKFCSRSCCSLFHGLVPPWHRARNP